MPPAPDLTRRPRTRRPFTEADMIRMRDLYYDRATPLTHVGDAFGVPVSTLLRWIAEMDWPRRSAQATRINPRVDLFAQVASERQAAPPSKARRKAKAVDPYALAGDVALAAQAELDALAAESRPASFEERRRRAAVIDQLSRAVARMRRVEKTRFADFDDLEKATTELSRVMTRREPSAAARRRGRPPRF